MTSIVICFPCEKLNLSVKTARNWQNVSRWILSILSGILQQHFRLFSEEHIWNFLFGNGWSKWIILSVWKQTTAFKVFEIKSSFGTFSYLPKWISNTQYSDHKYSSKVTKSTYRSLFGTLINLFLNIKITFFSVKVLLMWSLSYKWNLLLL